MLAVETHPVDAIAFAPQKSERTEHYPAVTLLVSRSRKGVQHRRVPAFKGVLFDQGLEGLSRADLEEIRVNLSRYLLDAVGKADRMPKMFCVVSGIQGLCVRQPRTSQVGNIGDTGRPQLYFS